MLLVHPVYGFLFQQRGAMAMAASAAVLPSGNRFAEAKGYGSKAIRPIPRR